MTLRRFLTAYGLGIVAFFVLWEVLEFGAQQKYLELVNHGVQISGTVATYEPLNHDNLDYTFQVGGTTYQGGGSFHTQGTFQPGQQVDVVYQQDNPSNNCSCNPKGELANAVQTPIVGGLFLGLAFPVWYLVWRSNYLRPPKRVALASPGGLASADLANQGPERPSKATRAWKHPGLPAWFWTGGNLRYTLPISVDDAAGRLQAILKPDGVFRRLAPPGGGALGWVQDGQFQITKPIPLVNNSFDSVLAGAFQAVPEGTLLTATFRLRPFVKIFMIGWLGFSILLGVPIGISALTDPGSWHPSAPAPFIGLVFPVFGVGVLTLGRALGSVQERRMVKLLDGLYGASPDPAAML